MYQKASPKGEPRTWFSHPKNSKNEVLPAWELNFRVLLFFVVFCVFGRPFENSSFTCMGAQFWRTRSAILCFLSFLKTQKTRRVGFRARWAPRPSKPRFWPHFGSILDRFWKDFWYNFGGVFYEKRCLTCMGAHFSKVSPYFVVSFLLAGISEIAVLPAWELIFREFA